MDSHELAAEGSDGKLHEFRSSEWRACNDCGIALTDANDSGIEVFTRTPGLAAPLCKDCEKGMQVKMAAMADSNGMMPAPRGWAERKAREAATPPITD